MTRGGLTVDNGGLNVQSGGLTVNDDPVNFFSSRKHTEVMTVTSTSPLFDQNVLRISAKRTTSRTDYNLFLVTAPSEDNMLFRIRGDGQVKIFGSSNTLNRGGLVVDGGGQTIYGSDGLFVERGLTIGAGGVNVSKHGLSVNNGGAVIYDHVSNQSTLLVRNRAELVNENVSVLSVEAIASSTGVPFPYSFNLFEAIMDSDAVRYVVRLPLRILSQF